VIRPDGVITGTSYGYAGQMESEFTLADPNDAKESEIGLEVISQTRYTYDDDGRITKMERAKDDGTFTFDNPEEWIVTDYVFDFLGRKTSVTEDANGVALQTTYEYNNQGELVKTTLPTGRWTKTERDGRGLVIKEIVGYGSGQDETEAAVTRYEYDANGNRIKKIDPDGTETHFEYDNYDRLIRVERGISAGS